jgi:hypothetical protein
MDLWWPVVPGLALVVAGLVIQFGTFFRRPRPVAIMFTGIRIRLIGYGALFLGIGVDRLISTAVSGLQVGNVLFGLVMIGFAGLWFYAASDRIFRRG